MSCSSLCVPSCGVCTPTPVADSCNSAFMEQCPGSTVVIQPPVAVVTFPGPILSSSSQQSSVGSSGIPYVSGATSGRRGGSGGFGGSCGSSRGCGPC